MHPAKKTLKAQTRLFITRILLVTLLAAISAVPAEAAVRTDTSTAAAQGSLIDEKNLSRISTDASSARWVTVGGRLRLKGSNGKYKTGFVKYNGLYYYFDKKGNLKTGFFTVKGKTWFASNVKGAQGKGQILSGLVWVNGKTYFMNPASTPCPGAISTGFQTVSGRRYYFDSKGRMVTGWFTVGGSKYYASCNKKKKYGALLTGVQKIGNRTYKFDNSGRLLGTVTDNQHTKTLADLVVIDQHPELPTGCEVTALTIVLNYLEFPASKLDLADNYLPKGPIGSTDFRKAFVGNPRNSYSYGCYAPVIVNTANKYLAAQKSKRKAIDISGRELTTLSVYTNANIPVIVWGTIKCLKPYKGVTWRVNGKNLTWISQEHCMVLTGFKNGKVQVADPYTGKTELYDLNLFRSRYNALFKQAVLIQ